MAIMRAAVLLTAVVLSIILFSTQPASAKCSADCSTGGAGESCMWCPQCGVCNDMGVIDRCYGAGTAHFSIDDGPLSYTSIQLDYLKAANVKASFWLIGDNIKGNEAVVQRMVAEGHFIADHTKTHPSLNSLNVSAVQAQVTSSIAQIQTAIPGGYPIKYMRAPYGEINTPRVKAVQELGIQIVLWNADTQDTVAGGDNNALERGNITMMLDGYSRAAHSIIILLHGYSKVANDAIPGIIADVQARGYRFVDFEECVDPAQAAPKVPAGSSTANYPPECVHPPTSLSWGACSATVGCATADGKNTCCNKGVCGNQCGAGCINGACDTCVAAGWVSPAGKTPVPTFSATGTPTTPTTPSSTAEPSSTAQPPSSTGVSEISSTAAAAPSTAAPSSTGGIAAPIVILPSSTGASLPEVPKSNNPATSAATGYTASPLFLGVSLVLAIALAYVSPRFFRGSP